MVPIDTKTGKPWNINNSNAKLQEVKAQCVADLRQLDTYRSHGRMDAANEWSTMIYTAPPDSDKGTWIIHPELSAIKHTGRDTRKLVAARWADWCSKPRDEDLFVRTTVAVREEAERQRMHDAAAEVESALAKMKAQEPPPPIPLPPPAPESETPPKHARRMER